MSEIINDDIISKDKRKSSEWVKPRTAPIARDYFGNKSTQQKPIDREVQKKSRQKEWFEEGQETSTNIHQILFNILKSGDADELSNFLRTHSELSNDPAFKTAQKILKTWKEISSDVSNYKSGRQNYQITDEESLDNTLNMTAFEDTAPLDSKYTVCSKGSNQPTLLYHTKHEAEEASSKIPGSTVRLVVPKTKTGQMGEGSMKAATRKPQGSKFGGYYKGTQKGAPKPNQSFGSTDESIELDEFAPSKGYPGYVNSSDTDGSPPTAPPAPPAPPTTSSRRGRDDDDDGEFFLDLDSVGGVGGRDKNGKHKVYTKYQFSIYQQATPVGKHHNDDLIPVGDYPSGDYFFVKEVGHCELDESKGNSLKGYVFVQGQGRKFFNYDMSDNSNPMVRQAQDKIEDSQKDLKEVAPPGKEKLVRKLKKEYPGHPEKAFATAWAIKNKTVNNKGKK